MGTQRWLEGRLNTYNTGLFSRSDCFEELISLVSVCFDFRNKIINQIVLQTVSNDECRKTRNAREKLREVSRI